ncbi:hypothetical protein, partial [Sulfoacidibacillus thermotolerans]
MKPKRVMRICVPVYEDDMLILNQLPPASKNQWARQLILRQLQIDSKLMDQLRERQGESDMTANEVRTLIQEEIAPLLDRMDSAILETVDEVVESKFVELKKSLKQIVEEAMRGTEKKPEKIVASETERQGDDEGDLPAWKKAFLKAAKE